ncbi:hypothetical protein FAZ95_01005 [Trinickia violacea]|uniref:Uncharacterized protein n=1 Tax=Trinickia violacea TaxID=2571746 RepID=A0A4P8IM64_9BURK|nr:hypothetical protein [Trinickia violacea]QCP47884.1 hypothetical protein FAZ95_01005 [Trinickia violacea]
MLDLILVVIAGLIVVGLLQKVIRHIRIVLLLGFLAWLAYDYRAKFFWSAGILILVLMAFGWYNERKVLKEIDQKARSLDASGFSSIFSKQSTESKEKIVSSFLQSSLSTDRLRLIEHVFIDDFFDYAKKQGSQDPYVFERSLFDNYANRVWRKRELMNFSLAWISSNSSKIYPEWHVSTENPIDQKSGGRVELIRLSKSQSVFDNVSFDLDDQ